MGRRDIPPKIDVKARLANGKKIKLQDCENVADIKVRVAQHQDKFATDVIVLNDKNIELKDLMEDAPQEVSIIFKELKYDTSNLEQALHEHAVGNDEVGIRRVIKKLLRVNQSESKPILNHLLKRGKHYTKKNQEYCDVIECVANEYIGGELFPHPPKGHESGTCGSGKSRGRTSQKNSERVSSRSPLPEFDSGLSGINDNNYDFEVTPSARSESRPRVDDSTLVTTQRSSPSLRGAVKSSPRSSANVPETHSSKRDERSRSLQTPRESTNLQHKSPRSSSRSQSEVHQSTPRTREPSSARPANVSPRYCSHGDPHCAKAQCSHGPNCHGPHCAPAKETPASSGRSHRKEQSLQPVVTETLKYSEYGSSTLPYSDISHDIVFQNGTRRSGLHVSSRQGDSTIDHKESSRRPSPTRGGNTHNVVTNFSTVSSTYHETNLKQLRTLDENGNTDLHYACKSNKHSGLQLADRIGAYLDSGLSINVRNKKKETPLHWAAKYNNRDAVAVLIAYEAEHLFDINGFTPLHVACESASIEAVSTLLLDEKCDINVVDNHLNTPLHVAVSRGNVEIVNLLLHNKKYPPRIEFRNASGDTIVELAEMGGYSKIVDALKKFKL